MPRAPDAFVPQPSAGTKKQTIKGKTHMDAGKAVSMPKRFTIIAALLLGAIAVAQGVRAFYGVDLIVNGYHIPVAVSWAAAAVGAIVSVLAFREADT